MDLFNNAEHFYHTAQLNKGSASNDRLQKLATELATIHHHGVYGAIPARAQRKLKEGQLVAMGALALSLFRQEGFFDGLPVNELPTGICGISCPNRVDRASDAANSGDSEERVA